MTAESVKKQTGSEVGASESSDDDEDIEQSERFRLQPVGISSTEKIQAFLDGVSVEQASNSQRFWSLARDMRRAGIKFRTGRFDSTENAILRSNWESLCKKARSALPSVDFDVSNCELLLMEDLVDYDGHNFRDALLEALPRCLLDLCRGLQRSPDCVLRRSATLFTPARRGKFSEVEDTILRNALKEAVENNSTVNFVELARELGRSKCAIKDRLRELSVVNRQTGAWTDEEELAFVRGLRELFHADSLEAMQSVATRSSLPWSSLAGYVNTRSVTQIRKHWIYGFRRKLAASLERVSNEPNEISNQLESRTSKRRIRNEAEEEEDSGHPNRAGESAVNSDWLRNLSKPENTKKQTFKKNAKSPTSKSTELPWLSRFGFQFAEKSPKQRKSTTEVIEVNRFSTASQVNTLSL